MPLLPGVGGRDTLLYGVESEVLLLRLTLGADLQTPVKGLYAIGDGAGVPAGWCRLRPPDWWPRGRRAKWFAGKAALARHRERGARGSGLV